MRLKTSAGPRSWVCVDSYVEGTGERLLGWMVKIRAHIKSGLQGLIPVIPVLRRLRKKNYLEFKASLGYRVRQNKQGLELAQWFRELTLDSQHPHGSS